MNAMIGAAGSRRCLEKRAERPHFRGRTGPVPRQHPPMRIFIYRQFFDHPVIARHNAQLAAAHRLGQHVQYLQDVVDRFAAMETLDPDEADFFFVPLFLIGWHFANHDPIEFIRLCEHLPRGRHLLLGTGDFGQRAASRHELVMKGRAYERKFDWLDDRFIVLCLESIPQMHPQDVAFLPYPVRDIQPGARRRDLFASFMGAMSYALLPPAHIRGHTMLRLKARHAGTADVLLGTPQEVAAEQGRALSYDEVMQRSVFTLCPAGYGRWSYRFVEALLAGSIPVLLADDYILPFADRLRWSDYGVVVPEARACEVVEILRAIPAPRVAAMQAAILADRAMFMRDGVLGMMCGQLAGRMAAVG